MFSPEIARPDVIDFVIERSDCTVTTLFTTRLSKSTPQAGEFGLTLLQVELSSCVYSHQSRIDLPAIPFSYACTCFNPAEFPAHADISWKYAVLWLRGRCLG